MTHLKKTLVIVAHPCLKDSVVNKRWITELSRYPEDITVHSLYDTYPEGDINIGNEQSLVDTHEQMIFQFPIYWYQSPALLKQWFDDVLTYGWAYGSKGKQLVDKKIGLAVSLGINEHEFPTPYHLHDMLRPFEMIFNYVDADYRGVFSVYGANTESDKITLTQTQLEQNAKHYIKFLSGL